MNFDKSTGIIEMFMDSLEVTDEGTFTFNLVDGKAKGTTSLVLIGDGKISFSAVNVCVHLGAVEDNFLFHCHVLCICLGADFLMSTKFSQGFWRKYKEFDPFFLFFRI